MLATSNLIKSLRRSLKSIRFLYHHIFQDKLAALAKSSEEAEAKLRSDLESETSARREEARRIEDFFQSENDARKKNLEDVNEWIREENEKRMKEAEALKVNRQE